ncbi:hypothetical protein ACHAWO_014031 [Cyclotella atomus]|uniref:Chalcone isomerase domain-containing protein n=1 Tax=Cyclotella atomus TaxID=382360 RepID=A0ABD3QET6_9STRA
MLARELCRSLKASWLWMLVLFASIARSPTHGFVQESPVRLSRRPSLSSSIDDSSSLEPAAAPSISDEDVQKIRTNYFIASSGFSPSSKSIISSLLDKESSSDQDALKSMASLEQSNRQALLNRISSFGEEYADYVQETIEEWSKEWEFRESASKLASEKAKVKQQEQLDTFMAMVRVREGMKQSNQMCGDGRLRFGMPYGERKPASKGNQGLQEQPPLIVADDTKESKMDTPILSQIIEEKKSEPEQVGTTEPKEQIIQDSADKEPEPARTLAIESNENKSSTSVTAEVDTAEHANDDIKNDKNPLDNLSLVQESTKVESQEKKAPLEITEAEMAAAEQRAANAKAAQEKADARKQQILDAETKKKEESKAKAEAILSHAEEEERLRIEKEQVEAMKRKQQEEEAARVKAEEEAEKARMQAEVEELARQQAEEEAAELARLQEEEAARLKEEEEEAARLQAEQEEEQARLHAEAQRQRIDAVESKMQSLTDKATSVTFDAKLDDGLYLVGVGVRKKAIINVYSVAMYSSPPVLEALSVFPKGQQKKEAEVALRDAARSFDSTSPMTSFVLEMTFKADGKTIAAAIADSVKPRYSGADENVRELESLIFEGVKRKDGQATKGTIFRFDCSTQGVVVRVDGDEQGIVECDSLGSAFVDVFMDDKAVSPKLVESCIETWSGSGL